MALKFYSDAGLTTEITTFSTTHPNTGSAVSTRLFLANDNALNRYDNVVIDPQDLVTTDETSYIQLAPDNAGSAGTYGAVGVSLAMSAITDNGVAKPFWLRVTTPAVGTAQKKVDLQLQCQFRESVK